MTWDETKILDRVRNLDCGHGNGCTCVDKLIAQLFEYRKDILKQHQEDARLWQIERERLKNENKKLFKLVEYISERVAMVDGYCVLQESTLHILRQKLDEGESQDE